MTKSSGLQWLTQVFILVRTFGNFLVNTVNNVDLGNDKRFEDEGCEVGKIQHSLRNYGKARVTVAASWRL